MEDNTKQLEQNCREAFIALKMHHKLNKIT